MSDLSLSQPDWVMLQKCNNAGAQPALRDLIADPGRSDRLVVRSCGIELDATRELIDSTQLDVLLAFGESADLERAKSALLGGAEINSSEGRPALHTALRSAVGSRTPSEQQLSQNALQDMRKLDGQLRSGAWRGSTGERFTDLVNIGIGGSDLGPKLVCNALARDPAAPRVHFLSNLDGAAAVRLMAQLNPATTAVQVTSKSFTTQETLTNAMTIRRWIEAACGAGAGDHFMAVSTNLDAAGAFGINPERVLPMWDWVGGRYSVWSPAGFAAAVGIGLPRFEQMLAGAEAMDQHFHDVPLASNLPVLLALLGIWYRNIAGAESLAVVPYAEELALLPAYLQQLEMESNGKSVRRDGSPVEHDTSPVIWGGTGTDVQHAFFQMLHQGTGLVPLHLIGVIKPNHDLVEHHEMLLANLFAQAQALAWGREPSEVERRLEALGMSADERTAHGPHRTYPGNRPSSLILLDELNPSTLGSLLALYEHKVFVQGWIWGINSFDQWGVELGKTMAGSILPALQNGEQLADIDRATQRLVDRVRKMLKS